MVEAKPVRMIALVKVHSCATLGTFSLNDGMHNHKCMSPTKTRKLKSEKTACPVREPTPICVLRRNTGPYATNGANTEKVSDSNLNIVAMRLSLRR